VDSIAQLQQQLADLQRQNQELRAGKSTHANQAEFLRQQQALSMGSAQDTAPALDSSDWWGHLGFGQQPQQAQASTPSAQSQSVTMTQAELVDFQKKTIEKAQREAAKTAQNFYGAMEQAKTTQQNMQAKLAQEHPDLVAHAPVIDRVWRAKLAENPKATPDQLFADTIKDTRELVNHVLQSQPNHPYGLQQYSGETPPWERPQGNSPQVNDANLFQQLPGNEMPNWRQDCASRNRHNRSKALYTYVPITQTQQQQLQR